MNTVLITGATGMIGNLIMERYLTSNNVTLVFAIASQKM